MEGNYTMTSKPKECRWQAKASLTIQQVQDQGFCIGTVPAKYQVHCRNPNPSLTRPLPTAS